MTWMCTRKGLFATWLVLAATLGWCVVAESAVPDWLSALVVSIALGWVTALLLRLLSSAGICEPFGSPILLEPLEKCGLGVVVQVTIAAAMLIAAWTPKLAWQLSPVLMAMMVVGWCLGQVFELPIFAPRCEPDLSTASERSFPIPR